VGVAGRKQNNRRGKNYKKAKDKERDVVPNGIIDRGEKSKSTQKAKKGTQKTEAYQGKRGARKVGGGGSKKKPGTKDETTHVTGLQRGRHEKRKKKKYLNKCDWAGQGDARFVKREVE